MPHIISGFLYELADDRLSTSNTHAAGYFQPKHPPCCSAFDVSSCKTRYYCYFFFRSLIKGQPPPSVKMYTRNSTDGRFICNPMTRISRPINNRHGLGPFGIRVKSTERLCDKELKQGNFLLFIYIILSHKQRYNQWFWNYTRLLFYVIQRIQL